MDLSLRGGMVMAKLSPAEKRIKEIEKWEREKARPKKNFYLIYMIFIISLVYVTDEVASQIGTLMKTEIANDMMASFGSSSVGMLDVLGMIAIPFQMFALFYKPLSDKLGRKMFLVINTLGMGIGLFLIFISNNIPLYVIGTCIIQFFVPHDMQVVYIMESAPPKHRARIYSIVKCFATLGVMMIPLLRRIFMNDVSEWRMVYLVPAVAGLVTSFIALLFVRETDAFIDSRLRYLRLTDEEIKAEKLAKKTENAQGGLVPAFRFIFRHKQLKWLFAALAFANTGFLLTMDYQVIMTNGYAQSLVDSGVFEAFKAAQEYAGLNQITAALFFFPVGSAAAQLIMGFIADGKSRRAAALVSSVICVASAILMWYGSYHAWTPYLVGFFSGACIGGFWSVGDIIGIMVGESAPTNLRSSIVSASMIGLGCGVAVSYVVGIPLVTVLGDSSVAAVCLSLAVPGSILSFLTLLFKTNDTTGLDLDKVTGCEWD